MKQIHAVGLIVDETPVTVELWRQYHSQLPEGCVDKPGYPVTHVSWNDALEWCKLRSEKDGLHLDGWRLLTDEEWETCCRAGTTGDTYGPIDEIAVYGRNSICEVATKLPNAWGLYDMLGLVWEWTASLYYPGGTSRSIRGGGWYDGPRYARASYRLRNVPASRDDDLGFRCARPIPRWAISPEVISPEVEVTPAMNNVELRAQLREMTAERDRWLKRVKLLEKREALIRRALEERQP